MKFICNECEEGCVLVTNSNASTPIICPFGFALDETNWKWFE